MSKVIYPNHPEIDFIGRSIAEIGFGFNDPQTYEINQLNNYFKLDPSYSIIGAEVSIAHEEVQLVLICTYSESLELERDNIVRVHYDKEDTLEVISTVFGTIKLNLFNKYENEYCKNENCNSGEYVNYSDIKNKEV